MDKVDGIPWPSDLTCTLSYLPTQILLLLFVGELRLSSFRLACIYIFTVPPDLRKEVIITRYSDTIPSN